MVDVGGSINRAPDYWVTVSCNNSMKVSTAVSSLRILCEAILHINLSALSSVVGQAYWKANNHLIDGCNMAGLSDEALALLLLENSWESWVEKYNKKKAGSKEYVNDQKPKYTLAKSGALENGGWSVKRRKWYNKLMDAVKKDCAVNGRIFDLLYMMDKLEEKTGQKKRDKEATGKEIIEESSVKCIDDLSNDSGMDNDVSNDSNDYALNKNQTPKRKITEQLYACKSQKCAIVGSLMPSTPLSITKHLLGWCTATGRDTA